MAQRYKRSATEALLQEQARDHRPVGCDNAYDK
jgi:hypothetical protein